MDRRLKLEEMWREVAAIRAVPSGGFSVADDPYLGRRLYDVASELLRHPVQEGQAYSGQRYAIALLDEASKRLLGKGGTGSRLETLERLLDELEKLAASDPDLHPRIDEILASYQRHN